MEARQRARRAFVAFWTHAPGLWLCYRATLGPVTKRHNLVAVGVTLAAMLTAWLLTKELRAVGWAWAVGHVAWGAWLGQRVYTGDDSS
ncbi:MAG: hypothetical protein JNK04_09425 [Myxococcales bacterium]|nr:hypothetical protein [Myxococcales bacterium]